MRASFRLPGDDETLSQRDERIERKRETAQDNDRGEDARGVERRLRLQDDEAEPGRGPGPLAEDGADGGVRGSNAHAGEDRRQRAGKLDAAEGVQPAAASPTSDDAPAGGAGNRSSGTSSARTTSPQTPTAAASRASGGQHRFIRSPQTPARAAR